MKMSKTASKEFTALYLRISREDNSRNESFSISNQRELLKEFARRRKLTNIKYYIDDGVSGTMLDRKEFTQMCKDIENGMIHTVIVKDLSRLSRDKSQANDLVEKFFPLHDVRFISVSDGIDSDEGEDEFLGFRTAMNEMYAKDISKKRKATNEVKDINKISLSQPFYGYMKHEDGSQRWVIDEDVAGNVKRIFQLTLEGKGTTDIAIIFTNERILSPTAYKQSKGMLSGGRRTKADPCFWSSSTIAKMLETQEYCGDVINHKTFKKNFKLKERYDNPEKSIHTDVHEAIIDRETWQRVQEIRNKKKRNKKAKDGTRNMFSGLLVCEECGKNLHFVRRNERIQCFSCSNYKHNRGSCETTHEIRIDFLEQVVLHEVHRMANFAKYHEQAFAKLVKEHDEQEDADVHKQKQKELQQLQARDSTLDGLFNRMYEDNASGKIDDDRFAKMSKRYTDEQTEIAEKIRIITNEIEQSETQAMTVESFRTRVSKYTRAKKVTEKMLHELIDKIEVWHKRKVDGKWKQQIKIYYHCIGAFDIPKEIVPPHVVTIQLRKNVTVTYEAFNEARQKMERVKERLSKSEYLKTHCPDLLEQMNIKAS